jgi:hypothetical protein
MAHIRGKTVKSDVNLIFFFTYRGLVAKHASYLALSATFVMFHQLHHARRSLKSPATSLAATGALLPRTMSKCEQYTTAERTSRPPYLNACIALPRLGNDI